MRKLFTILLSTLMIFTLTACGGSEEKNSSQEDVAEIEILPDKNKILVAYFSCTGTTKNLAETAAEILGADLYEIKPEIPYTETDLDHRDETTRATVEQRDEKNRPALADKNAPIEKYGTIVLAFPIWWGIEPRIMDTFVETYDLSNRTIIPIATSGSSEIGAGGDNLKALASPSAEWKVGKSFKKNISKDEVKQFFDELK
mgnify:CR=1 FL=1